MPVRIFVVAVRRLEGAAASEWTLLILVHALRALPSAAPEAS
jgi:hypothetical protein